MGQKRAEEKKGEGIKRKKIGRGEAKLNEGRREKEKNHRREGRREGEQRGKNDIGIDIGR